MWSSACCCLRSPPHLSLLGSSLTTSILWPPLPHESFRLRIFGMSAISASLTRLVVQRIPGASWASSRFVTATARLTTYQIQAFVSTAVSPTRGRLYAFQDRPGSVSVSCCSTSLVVVARALLLTKFKPLKGTSQDRLMYA